MGHFKAVATHSHRLKCFVEFLALTITKQRWGGGADTKEAKFCAVRKIFYCVSFSQLQVLQILVVIVMVFVSSEHQAAEKRVVHARP